MGMPSDTITAVSGVITAATVQQMRIQSTLNREVVISFITLNFRKSADIILSNAHSDGRFSHLQSITTDHTWWINVNKKELAFAYLKMFLYVSLCACICLSLYTQAYTYKIQLQETKCS